MICLISLLIGLYASRCVISWNEAYEERECSDIQRRATKYDPIMICLGGTMRVCQTSLKCKDCQLEHGLYTIAKTYIVNYSSPSLDYSDSIVYVDTFKFPNITYNINDKGFIHSDKIAIGYYKRCRTLNTKVDRIKEQLTDYYENRKKDPLEYQNIQNNGQLNQKIVEDLCYPLEFRIMRYLDVKYVYENSLVLWPIATIDPINSRPEFIVTKLSIGGVAAGTKLRAKMNTRYCCMVSTVATTTQNAKNKEISKVLCCGLKKCNCTLDEYIEDKKEDKKEIPVIKPRKVKVVKAKSRKAKSKSVEHQLYITIIMVVACICFALTFIFIWFGRFMKEDEQYSHYNKD